MFPTRTVILYLLAAGVVDCQCPDVSSTIAYDGTPVGSEEVIDRGKILKILRPKRQRRKL